MKVCYACKVEKPLTSFYKSNVHFHQKECKECNKERKGAWHKTPEGRASSAATKLKVRFGITPEQYDGMLTSQEGKCQICEGTSSYMGHKLSVDHCHTTGTIRGLLCKACNLGIGNFQDDVDRLARAIAYLQKSSSK